jgi:DmsE family decaheme c-type cytochrome
MTSKRALQTTLLLCSLVVLAGILAGAQTPAQNPPQGTAAKAGSINNEDCAACHEDVVKAFDKNPHAVLEKSPKFNMKNSCESCHGPGEDHASNDGDRTKIITFRDQAKKRYNDQCLTCHNKHREVNGFSGSEHAKAGLSCTDCHRVHNPAATTRLLRQPANMLCFSCHVDTRTAFSKPFHHRVRENSMRCTDCHQPHSGIDRRQVRTTDFGDSPCFKCHTDKEGPFVFEHAPTVIRECGACHESHGSNNPKMLVRSTVRAVCLECHTTSQGVLGGSPPAFHDIRSPRYQNCTTCHVKIHGSNNNVDLLR